ncbi:PIN2/TERF1-interacting telomerase inhibitor [Acrasis kona]|uniref:PIN2/TERF1-interacting telomerase inhibitor n=1 Tax=Acrasis kona TaxID=1008807 RepID=A0AAW2ZKN9_9EUKA
MSNIVGGPRPKEYFKDDPNNKEWANDTNRFGYRMLLKMGWTEGTGLGRKRNGNVDAVKIVKKFDNKGVGAEGKSTLQSYTANTVAFSSILSKLSALHQAKSKEAQKNVSSDEETEKEKKVTNRIHFSRRANSKNASNYSKEDMKAILGGDKKEKLVKKHSAPKSNSSIQDGNVLEVSKLNLSEYFKNKKSHHNNKSNATHVEISKPESSSDSSEDDNKAKKKKEIVSDSSSSSESSDSSGSDSSSSSSSESDVKNRKKKLIKKINKKRKRPSKSDSDSDSSDEDN